MMKDNITSVSLVLGSGGARGLAHIGVIRYLEEQHYEIRSIAGSSIGALIGGIYAAGKLDDYEQWIRSITKFDMISLLDVAWGRGGLIKGDRIINTMIEMVGEQLIEDLPIQFTAVATDITRQKEIWFRSGRLFDAIRASMSIPLFFTPFQYNEADLIDGGVLNPVPVAPTLGDHNDMTLAVNLGGDDEESDINNGHSTIAEVEPEPHETQTEDRFSPFRKKIARLLRYFKKNESSDQERDIGMYELVNQALEVMQSAIARQKLAVYPPDKVIEIARNACGTFDFDLAASMIDLGYRKARECFQRSS